MLLQYTRTCGTVQMCPACLHCEVHLFRFQEVSHLKLSLLYFLCVLCEEQKEIRVFSRDNEISLPHSGPAGGSKAPPKKEARQPVNKPGEGEGGQR